MKMFLYHLTNRYFMAIEICAVGGYNEVGKNMTAVKIDDEVIILDMGIHLEKYINFTDDKDIKNISPSKLLEIGAIPDDSVIDDWKGMVKAIVPSHAHLDHIAAIPFLAKKYDAPIIATPFSLAVLNAIVKDNKMTIKNKIIELHSNNKIKISKNITVEFVHVTHSTPQTVMIALHTKYGVILYACDFKFDDFPGLGKKPNYERLKELSEEGIYATIVDSTYSRLKTKMPSESVAKAMLSDVILSTDNEKNLIVVTTFSSHISRIKTIIELGQKINRKVILLGRSLSKYIIAGMETGLFQLPDDVEMTKYSSKINKTLKKIKNRNKYLLIVTGHQGETKAALSKLINDKLDFKLIPDDIVIFSSSVIPTETNRKNRQELEEELEARKCRIFRDMHVSGHAAREDLRYFLSLTKPIYVIPAHGNLDMKTGLQELCLDMDYEKSHVIILKEGERKELQ